MATVRASPWADRFAPWLFGSPFQGLPPQYGDIVPPELRLFEAEAELAQRSLTFVLGQFFNAGSRPVTAHRTGQGYRAAIEVTGPYR